MASASEQRQRRHGEQEPDEQSGGGSRGAILVALAANLVIAVAKLVAGLITGSPALLSEAAHSVADSMNELFLLTAVRRARRAPDPRHPFGYGKERFFWSFLAAVGIFVTGGCFSLYQGVRAWGSPPHETADGLVAGISVLLVALLAEGASLAKALKSARSRERSRSVSDLLNEPALRTVIAEDGTAVIGVFLALGGIGLHAATGEARWEAAASWAIGALLLLVAISLAVRAQRELIGQAVDPHLQELLNGFLIAQPEIDAVSEVLTMRLGPDSTLLAARVDLHPGIESESVERVSVRIKRALRERWPAVDPVFLDITDIDANDSGRTTHDPDNSGQGACMSDTMRLTSTAFDDGTPIPPQFSHASGDQPPPLTWTGAPDGTVELLLVCDDPDAPGGPFVHWLLAGIDPDTGGSEAGQTPAGAVSGRNGFGGEGYGGPHPPTGDQPHHYRFQLYALPEQSQLSPGFTTDELPPCISKALATTTLVGLYSRA